MKRQLQWMFAAIIACGMSSLTMTSCVTDIDNPVVTPDMPDYVERMYPVVDPQNSPQGVVMLRFYSDMPSVAYVSVSNFQSMMYPGTTVRTSISPSQLLLTSTQMDTCIRLTSTARL